MLLITEKSALTRDKNTGFITGKVVDKSTKYYIQYYKKKDCHVSK